MKTSNKRFIYKNKCRCDSNHENVCAYEFKLTAYTIYKICIEIILVYFQNQEKKYIKWCTALCIVNPNTNIAKSAMLLQYSSTMSNLFSEGISPNICFWRQYFNNIYRQSNEIIDYSKERVYQWFFLENSGWSACSKNIDSLITSIPPNSQHYCN